MPFSKLTTIQSEFLKSHKDEIIAELKAEALPIQIPETLVTCGKCLNFKCFNQHGGGAGICNAGVQSSGSCWWSESQHECEKFYAAVKWVELPDPKPDALTVICYIPAGKPIKVEATSPEHAEWLVKMNPKREAAA